MNDKLKKLQDELAKLEKSLDSKSIPENAKKQIREVAIPNLISKIEKLDAEKPKDSPKKENKRVSEADFAKIMKEESEKAPKSKAEDDDDDEPFNTAPIKLSKADQAELDRCKEIYEAIEKQDKEEERARLERKAMREAETKAEREEIKSMPIAELKVLAGEEEAPAPKEVAEKRTKSMMEKILSLFKMQGHKYTIKPEKEKEMREAEKEIMEQASKEIEQKTIAIATEAAKKLKKIADKLNAE